MDAPSKSLAPDAPTHGADPNYMPPLAQAIPLGVQHVLAMFVSNVTPAIIIMGAAGFGANEQAPLIYMIQMAIASAGVATLLQTLGLGPIGARLPLVQGTSFAFLPVMIPLVSGRGAQGVAEVLSGALCGGVALIALSFFVGRLRQILTPLVTGLVVLMIGLSLIRVGIQYAAGGVPALGSPAFGDGISWGLALLVIVITLFFSFFTTGFLSTASVLIGLIAGYRRGHIDEGIMRTMDILMSFPPILLGLLILSGTLSVSGTSFDGLYTLESIHHHLSLASGYVTTYHGSRSGRQ